MFCNVFYQFYMNFNMVDMLGVARHYLKQIVFMKFILDCGGLLSNLNLFTNK